MPRRSLTVLNPHADDFIKQPVSFWLVRRRALCKYAYLIDEPIRRGETVNVLIDGTLSAIFRDTFFSHLPRWLRMSLLRIEIAIWIRINKLNGKLIVHWSPATIANRSFLYVFSYKNCAGAFASRKCIIEKFQHKLINLSHYFIRTKEKAVNIASLRNVVLVADSDLRENEYAKKFFRSGTPMIVLPFAIQARFTVRKPLAERRGICAATGSFHNLREELPKRYYEDFMDFFQTDTYHPVRKLLYDARGELGGWLNCRISPYREMNKRPGFFAALLTLLRLDVSQAEYFSFDIVNFYNEHKFAVVGEEISGFPAIGFFEAMACGCVMLGQQGSFYNGLGLEPGVYYLTHDGSVAGIHTAIEKAMSAPGRIEELSQNGLDYVARNCTSPSVWDTLQKALDTLTASHETEQVLRLREGA
jgi:hypothetical protein